MNYEFRYIHQMIDNSCLQRRARSYIRCNPAKKKNHDNIRLNNWSLANYDIVTPIVLRWRECVLSGTRLRLQLGFSNFQLTLEHTAVFTYIRAFPMLTNKALIQAYASCILTQDPLLHVSLLFMRNVIFHVRYLCSLNPRPVS